MPPSAGLWDLSAVESGIKLVHQEPTDQERKLGQKRLEKEAEWKGP